MSIPTEILTRAAVTAVAETWPAPVPGGGELSPDALVLWDCIMEHLPKRRKNLPVLFPPLKNVWNPRRMRHEQETPPPVLPVVKRWVLWDAFSEMIDHLPGVYDNDRWALANWETDLEAHGTILLWNISPKWHVSKCLQTEIIPGDTWSFLHHVRNLMAAVEYHSIGHRRGRGVMDLNAFWMRVQLYKKLGRLLPDRVPVLPPVNGHDYAS